MRPHIVAALVCGCVIHLHSYAQGTLDANEELPKTQLEQQPQNIGNEKLFDDPLSGIIVNRSVTVLGQDFYRHFSRWWQQTDVNNRYTVSVHERPTAQYGSEIWVEYRQQTLFRTFMSPRRAATREVAREAVEAVYERVSQIETERLLVKNPDLGPEEL